MAVDNSSWDGAAVMARGAASDDPAAFYRAVCAGRKEGDPELQSSWALPHHENPGTGPNADGCRNAMSRLPQTEGLTNEEAARAHLEAHMAEIRDAMMTDEPAVNLAELGPVKTLDLDEPLVTLSVEKRILGLRLLTYNKVVDSNYGPIMFEPGAFGKVDPTAVRLRMDHEDPPTGIGVSFTDGPDAPLMEFRVSKTQRGDDQLTLARDGVSRGVSVGLGDRSGGPEFRTLGGKQVLVYPQNSAYLAEASTTWAPTFPQPMAGVMYALSKGEKGTGPMAEPEEGPAVRAEVDTAPIIEAVTKTLSGQSDKIELMLGAFEQWREQARAQFAVPQGEPRKPKLHHWVEMALRSMRGQPISPSVLRELALDDVITTDNPGAVPDVLTPDYDDIISGERPFLSSTRRVEAPATGTSMILPIITTRASAGTQYGGEKTDLTTTATKVGTGTFAYQSVFGGADISIQMLNRAERSFFDLLTGDMGMAYALDCEEKAIAALLAGYTDSASGAHAPVNGGAMDPTDPHFGDAWATSILASKRAPTHIWLSATAVGAFIDAKSPTTNAPLYSNLAASFTAGGGPGGSLSGLTPVYVPALDTSTADVIIGPARGFVWAEDPARNLQVDVPSKAGRDIALVGGLFPAPRYADAFTYYTLTS